jgi:hypothetical protein
MILSLLGKIDSQHCYTECRYAERHLFESWCAFILNLAELPVILNAGIPAFVMPSDIVVKLRRHFTRIVSLKEFDKSAASFCSLLAGWVPVMFCKFYLGKNHKIVYN